MPYRNKQDKYASNRRYRHANPEKAKLWQRKTDLKRWYGITLDFYNYLLEKQNGVCAICKRRYKRTLDVDHDHSTGRVRGLLCTPCNAKVAWFENYRVDVYLVRE